MPSRPPSALSPRTSPTGFDDVIRVFGQQIELGTQRLRTGAYDGPNEFSDEPFAADETACVIEW